MAFTSAVAPKEKSALSILSPVLSVPARIWGAMMASVERQAARRSAEIARLEALSDAELARMGLTRDLIVPHVLRDLMHR